jgi:tetratricopeptide (TPR) repeat protein
MYMMMYYSHNLHFGAVAASMQGHCAAATRSAEQLAGNLRPVAKEMPMIEPFLGVPLEMDVRCLRWDHLLAMSDPQAQTPALQGLWLYSRGLALVARGRPADAAALEQQLAALAKAEPRDEVFMPPVENHTWQILQLADDVLASRIAAAQGNGSLALDLLRHAVATQDQLLYDEPADWYYPVRENLGGLLLRAGDARAAEQVFRTDLEKNPRNPRSLFGLIEALHRQGRDYEAAWVKPQLDAAWKGADVELRVDDL